jgi:hypothetical protein
MDSAIVIQYYERHPATARRYRQLAYFSKVKGIVDRQGFPVLRPQFSKIAPENVKADNECPRSNGLLESTFQGGIFLLIHS